VVLPQAVAREAEAAASALVRLTPHRFGDPTWQAYHVRFLERYGSGAVVPLGQVVDADTGLGYPAATVGAGSGVHRNPATPVPAAHRAAVAPARTDHGRARPGRVHSGRAQRDTPSRNHDREISSPVRFRGPRPHDPSVHRPDHAHARSAARAAVLSAAISPDREPRPSPCGLPADPSWRAPPRGNSSAGPVPLRDHHGARGRLCPVRLGSRHRSSVPAAHPVPPHRAAPRQLEHRRLRAARVAYRLAGMDTGLERATAPSTSAMPTPPLP
jgi:hypothetical protein